MSRAAAGLLLLVLAGCKAREAEPPPAAPVAAPVVPDSLAQPMILSLRRDSLHIPAGATPAQVQPVVDSALATLKRVHDFEVIGVLLPTLAVKIRPLPGTASADVMTALRHHAFVADIEIDGFTTIQQGGVSRP